MPGFSPVSELLKLPIPVPSDVLLFVIVGSVVVSQQTPLPVTEAPPSTVIFPPAVADVVVIDPTLVVVNVGVIGGSTGGGHPVKTNNETPKINNGLIQKLFFFFIA